MSERVVEIALTQLVLWYDATRIQTWPSLLAAVPPETVLPSATDFGRASLSQRMTDPRHAAAEKITRNLPGLEEKNGRLTLRGLGLIELTEKGYRQSSDAIQLAEAYRTDTSGREWIRQLVALLLTREPRTRTFVGLLSHPGAVLRFTGQGWFQGSLNKARLGIPGVKAVLPFSPKADDAPCLREEIDERAWWSLGAWREHPTLREFDGCRFVGQLKGPYSLHDVGLALHASCEALLTLGILRSEQEECCLDVEAARRLLGAEIAADFSWAPAPANDRPLPQLLAELIAELRSDTGFVVASELRKALKTHGIDNPDKEIADMESAGVVRIDAEDYGQSRHGVGLYDDPRKQLIKIQVVGGH